MAQKQSQSSTFATQSLRPTIFTLMFDNLKQMLQQVVRAIVDRTLTAWHHSTCNTQHGVV